MGSDECSDRYIISLFPYLHTPSAPPPFSPSLISLYGFCGRSASNTDTHCRRIQYKHIQYKHTADTSSTNTPSTDIHPIQTHPAQTQPMQTHPMQTHPLTLLSWVKWSAPYTNQTLNEVPEDTRGCRELRSRAKGQIAASLCEALYSWQTLP